MINEFITKIMQKRIPQIERYMKNPIEVQDELLKDLVDSSRNTIWGQYYDYKSISNWEDFNNRVPVNDYDSLRPFFDRIRKGEDNVLWPSQIRWFSKSSGTTSTKSKFIPISEECLTDCHYKGGKDMLALYCNNNPNTKVFSGMNLALGGSRQENDLNKDIFCGDVSAILIDNLPFWAELYRAPKKDIALMPEWESKLEKMIEAVIPANVVSLSGVPSWMMVLLKKIEERTGKRIMDIWPELEVYFHGGVSFVPYRTQFEEILPKGINYMETYNASEGFFGLQDRSDLDSMLLLLDNGIYYEFISMDQIDSNSPKVVNLSEVEVGKNYAMLISTNAGLWRYMIGDTVMFTEKTPFRFKITGRTKNFINACGEEVIVDNAIKALELACRETDARVSEYTAAPLFDKQNNHTLHQWVIEFDKAPEDLNRFTEIFDKALQSVNSDYEAKRYKDFILQMPQIIQAPQGVFYTWLKSRGKLGGQNKVPRLSNSREYIDEILKLL
ncbi:MAG: GH3 auxin-responsive promoter family protein [Bacteroidales bacterium]|nr:GH3 auxin-responsive promoter family protein [Bacteroidales bacterium]